MENHQEIKNDNQLRYLGSLVIKDAYSTKGIGRPCIAKKRSQ